MLEEARRTCPIVDLGILPRHLSSRIPGVNRVAEALALLRYFRRSPPDVAVSGQWLLSALVAVAKWLAGVRGPLLVSMHSLLALSFLHRSWLFRVCMRGVAYVACHAADVCIAVSNGVANSVRASTGVAASKVRVIYDPVDIPPPSTPAELAVAKQFWPDGKMLRLLHVARMVPQKNHALLLRAVARLGDALPAQVMLLGNDPSGGAYESELRTLVAELGLQERVTFAGFQQPTAFYRTADLFVLTSDYEGLGDVLIEALACGLPCVATDCPVGPAEILDNGRFGTLVPMGSEQGDVQALAEGMRAELAAKRDPAALQARAAEFAPAKAAAQYLELMSNA